MQIKYRKVRLRIQDVEQQSAITSTGSAGVLRHLPPPVGQNGSTGKREGGSVWCGCLLLVWFSLIGIVFYCWCGLLPLVWISIIGIVFYHWYGSYYWYGFLLLVWFSIIGMIFFYWYDYLLLVLFCTFSLFCAVCNGLVLLVWYCAVDMFFLSFIVPFIKF